jgi:hypothetical protein
MPVEFDLIPAGTRLTANGHGAVFNIDSSQTRTFLCSMDITEQIEQESIDISVWGSSDGEDWGKLPLLKMPQRFYKGDTRQVLDLAWKEKIRFLRAKWELTRWGRVAPRPMFVVGLFLIEIPAFATQQATR